ncbi:MAG: glycosyltransferase family 4 protein [Kiritimatiellae bacterium]|nr:glycosyltransferase family 4 protein [Kiritimatiellia bacterium]
MLLPMHILHLLSNHKWSERAEPAADLAAAQQALGASVTFVCGRSHLQPEDSVAYQAAQKGLAPVVLEMKKHFRLLSALRDARRIAELGNAHRVDVVHGHMPNAHLIGILAARRLPGAPIVVRGCYEPAGPEHGVRFRLFGTRGTDGFVVIGPRTKAIVAHRFRLNPARIDVIEPGIDLARFARDPGLNLRRELGLDTNAFVLGVVARIRADRRLDMALAALHLLARDLPGVRLLVVGRGDIEAVITKPARRMGVLDRVVLAGYCRGERLVAAYRAMDLLVYPAPGTDQSCRTVREAMAAGLPVVASRVGFLPELIEEGETGRLVEPAPERLAAAIAELHAAPSVLAGMRASSSATAQRRFSLSRQAERTLEFYERLLHTRTEGQRP